MAMRLAEVFSDEPKEEPMDTHLRPYQHLALYHF
jgi:hypothetical protein